MREGVPGVQMAEAMEGLAAELLPFAAPFMSYLHGRFLAHFIEQDVIGHMEAELADERRPRRGVCGWRSRSPISPATRA